MSEKATNTELQKWHRANEQAVVALAPFIGTRHALELTFQVRVGDWEMLDELITEYGSYEVWLDWQKACEQETDALLAMVKMRRARATQRA